MRAPSSGSDTPRPAVMSWPTGRWCPFSGTSPAGSTPMTRSRCDEVRRRLLGEGAAASANGRLERLVLLEAVLACVVQLASGRPVVLVVEDLHWADAGSLGAVDHLARNLHDLPVLLVATYRPVDLDVAAPIRTTLGRLRRIPVDRDDRTRWTGPRRHRTAPPRGHCGDDATVDDRGRRPSPFRGQSLLRRGIDLGHRPSGCPAGAAICSRCGSRRSTMRPDGWWGRLRSWANTWTTGSWPRCSTHRTTSWTPPSLPPSALVC